tara:strand:- start:5365 stop:5646 length:282 start_codon:yes stop_codon:yes gene_type:complete
MEGDTTVKELESLCITIELMDVFHQKAILTILAKHRNEVTLNENKNGVLVNLSDVPVDVVKEICDYIEHVKKQECELNSDEITKTKLKNDFFK